jgi:hypothetical protein
MPEVVDHAAAQLAVPFELGHLRHDVGDRRVAHLHQIHRPPDAGHVIGQPFVHPERHVAAHQRHRNHVELELVGQLVDDQPVEQVGRLVHRHHDAHAHRLGEGADAFLRRTGDDVLLLELAAGLEEDERHLVREVVFELRAHVLIRALGVAGHPLEMRLDRRVVVNGEVVSLVGPPLEVVVARLVLAVVRDIGGLRGDRCREREDRHNGCGHRKKGAVPCADAHRDVSSKLGGGVRATRPRSYC